MAIRDWTACTNCKVNPWQGLLMYRALELVPGKLWITTSTLTASAYQHDLDLNLAPATLPFCNRTSLPPRALKNEILWLAR